MCGIWALFGIGMQYDSAFVKIHHRGPNAFRIEYDEKCKNVHLGFHRLAIVDGVYGMQPMRLHQYPHTILICNGELYNCKKLAEEEGFKYETFSDVECIIHLYKTYGIEKCVNNLDGVFSFCILDLENRKIGLGRDPYGVRPMFKITSSSGIMGVSSEAKGLIAISKTFSNDDDYVLEPFEPGSYEEYDILEDGRVKLINKGRYFLPGDQPKFQPFISYEDLKINQYSENIRKLLTMAVKKRLMSDRRIGCLLSGGLDSSLIASLLVKEAKNVGINYKIQLFSIGMEDSPDLIAATQVADFLSKKYNEQCEHHKIIINENDVGSALDEVIYTLETYDITTIRASIPMYLISKYVSNSTDTIVLFSGEGADEVAQGYIYFRDAPNEQEGHKESLRLLKEIYLFDGLRADRTTASQGLELRVPFLDLQFTNYYLSLPPKLRQPQDGLEKHLLRKAFDGEDVLPHHILWRHKEAFSDGVASKKKSLFVTLQEIIDKRMPEPFDIELIEKKYSHCTPKTKEALYYRDIFEKSYSKEAKYFLPHYWMPRWVDGVSDPSARFIKHYAAKEK